MEFLKNFIDFIVEWYPLFIKGTFVTFFISIIGIVIGSLLGIFVGFLRISKSKVLRIISTLYVEFIRGTPLTVILMIFYYGFSSVIPDEFSYLKNALILSIFAISVNSSAVVAEVIRGGVNSVSKGQIAAGISLGLTHKQIIKEIVAPQAISIILPSLLNTFIALIKDSSIVAFVGIKDITYQAKHIAGLTYRYFSPYIVAAIIYFFINYSFSKLIGKIEVQIQK